MIRIDYQEKLFNNRIKRSKDGRLPFDYGMICGVITKCIREDDEIILKGYAVGNEERVVLSINAKDRKLPYKYSKKYNIVSLLDQDYL